MGLDGGTVVNSAAFLKASAAQKDTKANDDGGVQSENELAQLEHRRRWSCCALSGKKFSQNVTIIKSSSTSSTTTSTTFSPPPVCCDQKGNLFLKESILEFLIAKKKNSVPESSSSSIVQNFLSGKFDHIKTMKNDISNLKLPCEITIEGVSSFLGEKDEMILLQKMFGCCILTDVPFPSNPRAAPFWVRWKCGHIFSSVALNDLLLEQKREERNINNNSNINNSAHSLTNVKSLKICPMPNCSQDESIMLQLIPPQVRDDAATNDSDERRRQRE